MNITHSKGRQIVKIGIFLQSIEKKYPKIKTEIPAFGIVRSGDRMIKVSNEVPVLKSVKRSVELIIGKGWMPF